MTDQDQTEEEEQAHSAEPHFLGNLQDRTAEAHNGIKSHPGQESQIVMQGDEVASGGLRR